VTINGLQLYCTSFQIEFTELLKILILICNLVVMYSTF
jgi:hypothetical protein